MDSKGTAACVTNTGCPSLLVRIRWIRSWREIPVARDTAETDVNGECKSLLRLFLLEVAGPSLDRGVWSDWLDA